MTAKKTKEPERATPPLGSGCIECRMGSPIYVACGRPAKFVVKLRDSSPYAMCDHCADHNVHSRGGKYVIAGDPIVALVKFAPVTLPVPPAKEPDDLVEEAEERDPPTDGELRQVAALSMRQVALEDEVARIEGELKKARDALDLVKDVELPALLDEIGIAGLPLKDGYEVSMKKSYHASVTKANLGLAIPWLDARNHGDIVKSKVEAQFGMGQDAQAQAVRKFVADTYPDVKVKVDKSIHSGTLSAFVREQIEAGEDVPRDIFSVHVARSTTITRPEKKDENPL